MDNAIAKAKEKREKLQSEIDLVDQYIKLHEQLFGENGSGTSDTTTPDTRNINPPQRKIRRRNNPKALVARAKKIITEAGHPIQRGDLVKRIENSGLDIHSDDKGKYIGTILWRNSDIFVNVEGHGYWVKSEPMRMQSPKSLPLE